MEQIAALEEKLVKSERAAEAAQRELADLKKNLERASERAVKEGSERTSAETKVRGLERDAEVSKKTIEELQKKVDALEKKIATLTILHKESDARSQTRLKERDKFEKEASDLRLRLAKSENDNQRLHDDRERAKKRDAQGVDDGGVDELEDEERRRLENRVRDLESENFDLRRGVWRERRKELDPMNGEDSGGDATNQSGKFTDVDLYGGSSPSRQRNIAPRGQSVGDFIASGFNALTGASATQPHSTGLLEDDDDFEFDEEAFRKAREEEAGKRIERVKEIKRTLKSWEGWRLDLVEARKGGGGGVGEMFEV
jgi:hypothetical protein